MRYLVMSVLQAYDQEHGTAFFTRLAPSDIDVQKNAVDRLLEGLDIPMIEREARK